DFVPVGSVTLEKALQARLGYTDQVGFRIDTGPRGLDAIRIRVGCKDSDMWLPSVGHEMLDQEHGYGVRLLAGRTGRYPDGYRLLRRGAVQQILDDPCPECAERLRRPEERTATHRQGLVRCSRHSTSLTLRAATCSPRAPRAS